MHILGTHWFSVVLPCWVGFSRDLPIFSRFYRFFPEKNKLGKRSKGFSLPTLLEPAEDVSTTSFGRLGSSHPPNGPLTSYISHCQCLCQVTKTSDFALNKVHIHHKHTNINSSPAIRGMDDIWILFTSAQAPQTHHQQYTSIQRYG